MTEVASQAGKKLLALAVLLLAAYVLFKVVIGVVTTLAWIAVICVALIAVVWAIRVL